MPVLRPFRCGAHARQARPALRRGFTLVEMMLAVAVSGVVGTGVVLAGLTQTRTYVARLAEMDARLQAQTVLAAIEDAASLCGFGFGHANDHVGVAATGVCAAGTNYQAPWAAEAYGSACTGVDTGGQSDRLRFSYVDAGQYAYLSPSAPSAGPCGASLLPPNVATMHFAELGVQRRTTQASFPSGLRAFIGGPCQGGGPPSEGTDMVTLVIDALVPIAGCREIRPYVSTNPGNKLSCPQGYAPGFAMGRAETREFYADTDPISGLPRLMMGAQVGGQPPAVVAVGVTRFEVRYGFDTSSARTHKLSPCPACDDPYGTTFGGPYSWCRGVQAADAGGTCLLYDDTGAQLSTRDLQNRIIAVHVTFDLVAVPQTAVVTKLVGLGSDAKTYTFSRLYQLPNMAT